MSIDAIVFKGAAAALTIGLAASPAAAQTPPFHFVDCSTCGIEPYTMADGMGAGLAAADVNDDGFVDLFVPTAPGTPNQLYLNRGRDGYEEVALEAGLASLASSRTALWLDDDGDGDLDLLVANDDPEELTTYRLYRQVQASSVRIGFRFKDVTRRAGLYIPLPPPAEETMQHRGGMAAGDLDNDGFLDLVTCLWNGAPQVFRNQRNGTFRDVTKLSRVRSQVPYPWQPVLFDVNGDGWLDIFLAVDFRWNALFINQQDGTFVDIAADAGADNAWNDMGVAIGDVDRDRDFDLYVTNITAPATHNILLRNETTEDGVWFDEVSRAVDAYVGGWAWGTTFLDADLDGWLDIACTNGWHSEGYRHDPSRFYWSRGIDEKEGRPLRFDDVSAKVDFDDTDWGSALIAFDVERDGDLDLLQSCKDGPVRVLLNAQRTRDPMGNFLTVRPRMDGPNSRAIGAVVRVTVAGETQDRLITAGTSFLSQEPAEAHFGVGAAEVIDRVEIFWPDRRLTVLSHVEPEQILDVTLPSRTPEGVPPVPVRIVGWRARP